MAKIISRQSLGIQPVYDIGVAQDHNFLLENGTVAANCFNKSHSTAYGFVTFQTAYLKAHYPVEYMAALLTANSGDQEKVQSYIANCVAMGIEVLPPNINHSQVDFTPEGKSILFGLSAVRNVGQGAIDCILQSRQEKGPFRSLADLCDRVDLHAVNRRALEALIQSGALDPLEPNRKQLMQDLELVLDWAQGRAKDRAIGQGNLFDMMGTATSATAQGNYESAPKAPPVADFEPQEKLRLEKELLGLYISAHPLKAIPRSAKLLTPVNLTDIDSQAENTTLSAIVLVSQAKTVVTKKGERMAILTLEDLTGSVEAVVFPRSYERIGAHIKADARLVVWGKCDRRDDQVQFIVEDAEPIETVQMVMVAMPLAVAKDIEQQNRLRNIIRSNQGDDPHQAKVPVIAVIQSQEGREVVRFGVQFRVNDPHQAVSALQQARFYATTLPLIPA